MDDCIFCKIVRKEIPSRIVFEDEALLAFRDISPIAPVHIIIIPKKHISDLASVQPEDLEILGRIQLVATKLAEQEGISERGYRVINNCREEGGQVVKHIHYHLVGGRQMGALG